MSYFDSDIPGYDKRYPALKRRSGIGIIDVHEDDPEEEEVIQYCPHCLEAGFHVKLGPKILMPGEKRAEDYESWLQCDQCYSLYGVHEIEKQKNLQSELKQHKVESPFDAGKTIIESIPKRTSPAGRKAAAKRRRERDRPHHKDKEIDEEMRKHGDRVIVLEDTDP